MLLGTFGTNASTTFTVNGNTNTNITGYIRYYCNANANTSTNSTVNGNANPNVKNTTQVIVYCS